MAALNTTGYALLGLLNQHPWSAYDLTRFMRVSYLRAVWPRAESRLYEGPKKLVERGYATAAKEQQGKRTRTVYSITEQGRAALRAWLRTETRDVVFEHEALLQLGNCDAGELEDLLGIIERISVSTQRDIREMRAGMAPLASPETQLLSTDKRFVINTLINTFIHETLLARARWLRFAQDFTQHWQDLEPDKQRLAQARAHYASLVAALDEELLK